MPLSDTYKSGAEGAFNTPVASAARTASGNSGPNSWYAPTTGLIIQANVTAVSGTTPTLTLILEDSVDGGTTWNTHTTVLNAVTATGVTVARLNLVATPCAEMHRYRWVVGGTTPSFTFQVDTYALRA